MNYESIRDIHIPEIGSILPKEMVQLGSFMTFRDAKGKIRKERIYKELLEKGYEEKTIPNEPTAGFIITRFWNGSVIHGSSCVRTLDYIGVEDPRGGAFDISVKNLLFILAHCSVECKDNKTVILGKLVYSWQGADIILVPENTEEYKHLKSESKKIFTNIENECQVGCVYRRANGDVEMYLGEYEAKSEIVRNVKWTMDEEADKAKRDELISQGFVCDGGHYMNVRYRLVKTTKKIKPLVLSLPVDYKDGDKISCSYSCFSFVSTLSKRYIECIVDKPHKKIEEILNYLTYNGLLSPIDESKTEYVPLSFEELKKVLEGRSNYIGVSLFSEIEGKIYDRGVTFEKGVYKMDTEGCAKRRSKAEYGYFYRRGDKDSFNSLEEVFEKGNFRSMMVYCENGKFFHKYNKYYEPSPFDVSKDF